MSREEKEESAISSYNDILNELLNLSINNFKWANLPFGLTSEQLELLLITKGQLMFFYDDKRGYLVLPCFPTADINPYGLATTYIVNAENGKYNKEIDVENGVIIKNNPLGSADINRLETFAKRIDNVEMTQDVNLFQQNMPKLILADEDSKLTSKTIVERLKKFSFVVFGKKSLLNNISTSDVLDTSSPYILDKLQEHKNDLRNEILTFRGINNNKNSGKRERQIVDEVNANNEEIECNVNLMFELREQACKLINEKYKDYVEEYGEIKVSKREVKQNGIGNNDPTKDN